MRRALEAARDGHGQIVAAMGEPGVGKSRLLFEFKAVVQSDCMVLEAYSISHGKASAYVPVVELLRKYFRIVPEDDARQRRQKVIGKLLELDRSLEDSVPYVFGLLGIHEGDDPFAQMDAQIRRRRTQDALKHILLRESLNQPLIVVFEDLHWIDNETRALLNLLADSIANARILLLVNYRPEYRHEWGHRTHYTQLRLDPLSAAGAEEMLDALLVSGSSLPGRPGPALAGHGEGGNMGIPELKRLILDRTQGNPFFIEEIVQALFEEGLLVRNGALKVVRPPSQVHVPASVQGVLTSRIDRLPAEEKELLQTLAVIGREFPAGLVRAVTQRTEAALDGMLSHLQGAEFIYEQPAFPDVEYTFKHALTQEVAYNSAQHFLAGLGEARLVERVCAVERRRDHRRARLALRAARGARCAGRASGHGVLRAPDRLAHADPA
jgi:predicted ATPase